MKKLLLCVVVTFMSLRWAKTNDINPFKPIMSIRIERCTSYCNPKYCNISSICRPLNRTSKSMSLDIYLHPGVKLEAPVYVKTVALKKFATVYRPHMINLKTELCKELAFRTHPLLFGLTTNKTFQDNLFDPCPITGHRHTKPRISNIYDFDTPLLRIVPSGEWRFDVIISLERNRSEVIVVSWSDYYEVKALTAEEF